MKLTDIYRASDVFRWQIVKTIRQQSIAEHSYQVAMIAHRILLLLVPNQVGRGMLELEVLKWSLYHDLPEVMTGDIATPLKQYLKKQNTHGCIEELEDRVSPQYRMAKPLKGSLVQRIVKLADIMEAIKFVSENAATVHGTQFVRDGLERDYNSLLDICTQAYPDLDWRGVGAAWGELFDTGTHLDDIFNRQGEEK